MLLSCVRRGFAQTGNCKAEMRLDTCSGARLLARTNDCLPIGGIGSFRGVAGPVRLGERRAHTRRSRTLEEDARDGVTRVLSVALAASRETQPLALHLAARSSARFRAFTRWSSRRLTQRRSRGDHYACRLRCQAVGDGVPGVCGGRHDSATIDVAFGARGCRSGYKSRWVILASGRHVIRCPANEPCCTGERHVRRSAAEAEGVGVIGRDRVELLEMLRCRSR